MLSKNHLIVNGAVAVSVATGVARWAAEPVFPSAACLEAVAEWLGAPWSASSGWSGPLAWWLAACLGLFFAGSVFPDIDNPKSLVGRWFRWLPLGPHRGITHAVWAPLVLGPLVLVSAPPSRQLAFFFAGWLAHELADAPSKAGWAPWWPLGRWRTVVLDGVGVVVRDRGPRIYRVGRGSETAVVVSVVALSMLVTVWLGAPLVGAWS